MSAIRTLTLALLQLSLLAAQTAITAANVASLQLAWTFDTRDAFPGSEMQCRPTVVDGILYATTPKLRLIALDAATGAQRWQFDPNQGRAVTTKARNRGVTYWSNGKQRRIFFAARQYLYSVDAYTGLPDPAFGASGHIDLRENLGRDPQQMSISLTSPPVVYRDLLILGGIVSESLPSSPGYIRAYDLHTGKLRWTFHTIPHPGEPGYETWPKDAWAYTGGVNNWTGMAVDEKRGLVFAPTGSAAFDFYGANRLGDNLYANCLLALDARTGRLRWHFQTVKHDLWDRDLPSPPSLVQVQRDGRTIDAVAQTTKSGFVYVFERETGKPLFPIEYRKYPASDAEGEVTAETQPLPTKPAPFARQALTADMLTTRTPEAHAAVLDRFQKVRSAGQFVPPSAQGTIVFPGFDGGAEWGGSAFDPDTGILYVNSNEMAWILRLVENPRAGARVSGRDLYLAQCASCHRADLRGTPPEFPSLAHIADRLTDSEVSQVVRHGAGRMPAFATLKPDALKAIVQYVVYGTDSSAANSAPSPLDMKYGIDGYNRFLDPDGYPAIAPPWGTLNAINLNTGEYAWKIPFGEYPKLGGHTGSENYGGPVVTPEGLLFIGATNFDNKFHAFDKRTGTLLWEATLPAAGNATPVLYQVNGRQYIAIACGGGKSGAPSGGKYVAFALPQ